MNLLSNCNIIFAPCKSQAASSLRPEWIQRLQKSSLILHIANKKEQIQRETILISRQFAPYLPELPALYYSCVAK
ncbi:hypothetical protein HMPREF0494_1078 [Limosilactobacillus antri DSM 16041]|uniref:Uncharacterized protein n=1 Tax=Limosilactobacillus antri DSM 16041 TaxID=525309 RepID=C8P6Y4_9LACO|nr:hypothetical protein HMPREF0494_1078 [Limosilactobacillus antri DSM 16041]KRK59038.1 hypothetical protein FC31_GL000921 [Limosilactobacillus antri DSM 16041]